MKGFIGGPKSRLRAPNTATLLSMLVVMIAMVGVNPECIAVKTVKSGPWLRLEGGAHHIKINKQGTKIAFTDRAGKNLQIVDLKTQNVYAVTPHKVEESFFWGPEGLRLFFRALLRGKNHVKSQLSSYDSVLHKAVPLETFPEQTGLLTFDPYLQKLYLMTTKGIHTKRIITPARRPARWQTMPRTTEGQWVAAQKGICWVSLGGFSLRKLKDDGSGVESFDISPDGKAVIWSTQGENVYFSELGQDPVHIGEGRDPKWHPEQKLFVYASSRKVGKKTIGYDLRVSDTSGTGRYITDSQGANERWPNWLPDGQHIIYAREHNTDIFITELNL